MRRLRLVSVVCAAALALPFFVGAHATPVEYQPFASAILPEAPQAITIRFTEHIEPGPSSLRVFAPLGTRADSGSPFVDLADPHSYGVPVRGAGQGTYTVVWHVISADDGHFTQGAYVFSVGVPSVPAVSVRSGGEYRTTLWVTISVFLELLGQALAAGGLAVLFAVLAPLHAGEPERKRLRSVLFLAGLAIVIGIASYLVERSFAISRAQGSSFTESFLIFAGTYPGTFALGRGALALAFMGAIAFRRSSPFSMKSFSGLSLIFLMACIVLGRAIMSHAFASHFHPFFSVGVNFLHLLSKEIWIGGVVALLAVLSVRGGTVAALSAAAVFVPVAAYALGIGGVTGSYIIWLHLKGFSQAFATAWGRLFVLMIVIAFFFLAARVLEQRRERVAIRRLRRDWKPTLLFLEAILGILILVFTSRLILTTPPLHSLEPFMRMVETQGVAVSLREAADDPNSFAFAIDVPALRTLTLLATNAEKGVGPIAVRPEEWGGEYRFSKSIFAVPGDWSLGFVAERQSGYDLTGSLSFRYPDDLQLKRADEAPRAFDSFAMSLVLASVLIVCRAMAMYRFRP